MRELTDQEIEDLWDDGVDDLRYTAPAVSEEYMMCDSNMSPET